MNSQWHQCLHPVISQAGLTRSVWGGRGVPCRTDLRQMQCLGTCRRLQGTGGSSLIIRTLGWVVKEGEPLLVHLSFKKQRLSS